MKGKFITIEGSEGAGKTTVIDTIVDFLRKKSVKVIVTREPGGTNLGEKVRSILLDKDNHNMHPDAELLLMFAARSQHWHEKIFPNLEAGKWVLSDRFLDSSFAYQGGGRQIPLARIEVLANWTLGKLRPDLTIFLDIDPEIGLSRINGRGELDRFEVEEVDFFKRVRDVFLKLSDTKSRFALVDASQTESLVKSQVLTLLEDI